MSGLRLLEPTRLGDLELPNRIVMAPMTRRRAGPDDAPRAVTATYYAQRASAGLIVSEATLVSAAGASYPGSPGLYTPEHVRRWRRVADAVHEAGGRIYCQLWHAGRVSHPSVLPEDRRPVAPSAVAIDGRMGSPVEAPFPEPRALETDEVEEVVADFRAAARRAREAGFDGVEIHGANGYLIDTFLRDGTNRRKDRYGGSAEERARFLLEVTDAALDVWPPGRVGVQLSPVSELNDMTDSDPAVTFGHAARRLDERELAYLAVHEMLDAEGLEAEGRLTPLLRDAFDGPLVVNGGYDRERAEAALRSGEADLVSFGRLFVANPDLPRRCAEGAPLNEPDPSTFYGGGAEGYTDYPFLDETSAGAP